MGILSSLLDPIVGIIDPVVDMYNESKARRDKAAKKRADDLYDQLKKSLDEFVANEEKKNKDK